MADSGLKAKFLGVDLLLLGFVFNLQNVSAKFPPLCCHFFANRITFQKKRQIFPFFVSLAAVFLDQV